MQIVSIGDNLHEMSNPVFWEKYFKMLSTENFTQSANWSVKVQILIKLLGCPAISVYTS